MNTPAPPVFPAPLALALAVLLAGVVACAVPAAAQSPATADAAPAAGPAAGGPTLTPAARAALGITTDAGAALYAQSYAAALDFRLGAATEGFRQLGAVEPGPAAAYGLENTAMWKALMTEADDDYDRFYALNDSLADVADDLDDAPGARLAGAAARLHRALVYGRQERYARAATSFRDACGRFRDLDGPDALFGQGVCESAAGAVPRKYRWLARLLGFRGNVTGGLAKLEAAAGGGGALAVEATIGLATADATLNERRAGGVEKTAALALARPTSPVLAYLAATQQLLDRRAADAEAHLRRAVAAMERPGVTTIPFVQPQLGAALFRQRRFAEAAPLLEEYALTFRGPALKAQSTLEAAIAYEMTGDRTRAERLYRRVKAARDYDSDQAAERDAKRRLQAPMTATDRALVSGGAAYDGGDYDDAVAILQPIVTDSDLPAEVRAEAAYRTGRSRQAQENWPDALRHFRLAADRPGDPLAKWGPWSVYHQGEIHEATGDLDQAQESFDAVLENETEFDYHKALEQRTRAALERIGR